MAEWESRPHQNRRVPWRVSRLWRVIRPMGLPEKKVAPRRRERIEAAGAQRLYLPPYSPDCNPMEKSWGKVTPLLRSAKARTREVLQAAVAEALTAITPQNASAWLCPCEYGIQLM